MPTFSVTTPDGRALKVEAPDEGAALSGSQYC
jgi:hypothetical protein